MSEERKVRQELLDELNSIDFPLARSRKNIIRGGVVRQGFVLGRVFNWGHGLLKDSRRFRPSNKTSMPKYEKINELAKKLMKLHNPNFKYTSIQFNKDNRTAKHVDAHNVGVSEMIGLGDYSGGDVRVFDEFGKNPKDYNVKNKWLRFDGSLYPHETTPFTGTRYTLVYYDAGRKGFK